MLIPICLIMARPVDILVVCHHIVSGSFAALEIKFQAELNVAQ